MKKFILSTVAITMLLSNVAFAATRPSNANSHKTNVVSTVKHDTGIHLFSLDPY